jgi:hypothetical protein
MLVPLLGAEDKVVTTIFCFQGVQEEMRDSIPLNKLLITPLCNQGMFRCKIQKKQAVCMAQVVVCLARERP